MLRRLALLMLVPALVISAGACGAKKHAQAPTTSTTAPSPDLATAQKLVVVQSDLPAGWDAEQQGNDSGGNLATGVYDQLTSCAANSVTPDDRTVLYSGAVFTRNGNAVASSASAYKTPEQVTQEIDGIKDSSHFNCITTLINGIVSRAVPGGSGRTTTSSVTPVPGVTTAANEFALRIRVDIGGGTTTSGVSNLPATPTVYIDLAGVGKDRYIATATFAYFNAAPPSELEQNVLQKLAQHAQVLG